MHAPVRVRPCASARSAAQSAPDATFFASSWAAMEERPPRLPARWRQPPELELSSRVLPSPRLLWSTGPVATTWPQAWDEEYLWESFSGTRDAPAGQGFDPRPQHLSTLLLSSQQGLRALCQDLPHSLNHSLGLISSILAGKKIVEHFLYVKETVELVPEHHHQTHRDNPSSITSKSSIGMMVMFPSLEKSRTLCKPKLLGAS